MIPTLDGRGYWLIASDGGVFAFGDALFYGSAGGENLASPVTAAAGSYLDGGYWLVDSNGQIYSYGDAKYEGQPTGAPGGYRITGMAASHSSNGYWLASANGNVATFGDAAPYGDVVGMNLNAPIVGMTTSPDGAGYWLQGADGGHLHLRRRSVLGLHGWAASERADGGHRLDVVVSSVGADRAGRLRPRHADRLGCAARPRSGTILQPRPHHEDEEHGGGQHLGRQRLVGP